MSIDTGDHPPVAKRPYTLVLKHHDWVKAEIDKLLEAGVIRESDSSWSAPIVVVPKGDGGKRLYIDNKDKLELKWEPNYRIIRFPHLWSAVVENQFTGRTKRCNVSDLKIKHQAEDWDLKPATLGRAARFVNHPDNLPDVDFKPNQTDDAVKSPPNKYNLR